MRSTVAPDQKSFDYYRIKSQKALIIGYLKQLFTNTDVIRPFFNSSIFLIMISGSHQLLLKYVFLYIPSAYAFP